MKKLLIAFVLLSGCSGQEDGGGNMASSTRQTQASRPETPQGRPGAAITTLTGLYEGGGEVSRKSQLCMVDPEGETARFGLVAWGENDHSCSGSGTAERKGDRLALRMTGDEACTIEARINGLDIVLPDSVPDGCAYYCGARAQLGGARFTQVGTGRDDAAKAVDLVGDPLC
jgi:hypothetical protein